MDIVDTIEQLAVAEACLWNIHEALAANSACTSFFCREYWGSSASQAQLSLEKLPLEEQVHEHVRVACAMESVCLALTSHLCSRIADDQSGRIQQVLCTILGSVRGNCLVLLSLARQQWHFAGLEPASADTMIRGHCPTNLNFDILSHARHFRQLSGEEHIVALRSHNNALATVLMAFCSSGAALETDVKADLTEQGFGATAGHAERTPNIFRIVIEAVTLLSAPLACFSISGIRAQMLKHLRFCPLVNSSRLNPSCTWPDQDRYVRFGCEFASDAPIIWFAPLPPIFTDLNQCPRLPAAHPETYTLVLDLDETLVHHSVINGSGFVGFRPGVGEFLRHTSLLGYELVVFTAATQDYADACIDMVDPDHLVRHRLYRQHALSWGPVFVKDLSRIGRDLDRTLIIDNIRENFMLQPHNGIFIYTWLDDPQDTALSDLVPVLDEIIMTRSSVPSVLTKYREQIPEWAGWKTSLLQAGATFDHGNDAGNSSAAV